MINQIKEGSKQIKKKAKLILAFKDSKYDLKTQSFIRERKKSGIYRTKNTCERQRDQK